MDSFTALLNVSGSKYNKQNGFVLSLAVVKCHMDDCQQLQKKMNAEKAEFKENGAQC